MSTVKVDTIKTTGNVEVYTCKAWVNFDGQVASSNMIRGSGNVSSITDHGTGDYTVNFQNNMTDANYSTVYTTGHWSGSNYWGPIAYTNTQSTSGVRIRNNFDGGTFYDAPTNNIAVFR